VSPDQVFVIVIVMGSIAAWTVARVFRGPVGEAIARRIGGSAPHAGQDDQRIADLQSRMAELEERLDFTERVLSQERQAGQLGQGELP
jgi:hypothetical protein